MVQCWVCNPIHLRRSTNFIDYGHNHSNNGNTINWRIKMNKIRPLRRRSRPKFCSRMQMSSFSSHPPHQRRMNERRAKFLLSSSSPVAFDEKLFNYFLKKTTNKKVEITTSHQQICSSFTSSARAQWMEPTYANKKFVSSSKQRNEETLADRCWAISPRPSAAWWNGFSAEFSAVDTIPLNTALSLVRNLMWPPDRSAGDQSID